MHWEIHPPRPSRDVFPNTSLLSAVYGYNKHFHKRKESENSFSFVVFNFPFCWVKLLIVLMARTMTHMIPVSTILWRHPDDQLCNWSKKNWEAFHSNQNNILDLFSGFASDSWMMSRRWDMKFLKLYQFIPGVVLALIKLNSLRPGSSILVKCVTSPDNQGRAQPYQLS